MADKIDIKKSHKGLLHKDLGIPEGEPIPVEKIQEALKSKDPAIRMRARFAMNARKFTHTGGK